MSLTLPVHCSTGQQAIGFRRDGRPIWPILGASPDDSSNPPVDPKADPKPVDPNPVDDPTKGDPKDPADKPLGPNGEKALQAERDARKALEKELAELAPLKKIAAALGGGDADKGKTDFEQLSERLSSHEGELAKANVARFRAEVALAKRLTPEQAAELQGSTTEELNAHADRLVAAFGGGDGKPGSPKPDRSQGGGDSTEAAGSVSTGRDLFRERHKTKTST